MQLYDRGIGVDLRRCLVETVGASNWHTVSSSLCQARLSFAMATSSVWASDLSLKERDCARTPMQWSDEPHGGFTKHDKPICPVISQGPYGFEHVNAAIQRRYPDLLLDLAERIIRMRKELPEVGWGDFAVIPMRNPSILVIRYTWRNNSVLLVHNFDAEPHEIAFATGAEGSTATSSSICSAPSTARRATTENITLSSRGMGIDGTASAGWTISCGERTLAEPWSKDALGQRIRENATTGR